MIYFTNIYGRTFNTSILGLIKQLDADLVRECSIKCDISDEELKKLMEAVLKCRSIRYFNCDLDEYEEFRLSVEKHLNYVNKRCERSLYERLVYYSDNED